MSFALTIFISSFFLFQIQPIIARYILPWYGGSPTVWSTCMLFFQLGLLAGYIYAHLLARYLQQRQQVFLHITLLLLSLFWLPITPDPAFKPSGIDDPVWGIIQLLFLTVGTPYILISSTGPLLQHWYRLKHRNRSPYRLYALSNVGSLLGLISYPFLVEPNMALGSQTFFWSCGYVAFFLVCVWSGWSLFSAKRTDFSASHVKEITAPSSAQRSQAQSQARPLLWLLWLLWIGLSACASVLFLAVTGKITQDVSVIPFLWVVPLSLYLCTLIIAFDSPRWYRRRIWLPAFLVSCGLLTYLLHPETELHILWTVFLYSLALFCIVMVCHGELARSKPPAHQLTLFYLMISLGGALGGAFVSFVATNLFPAYWELEIGVGMALLLVGFTLFCSSQKLKRQEGHWLSVKKRTWAVYSLYSLYSIYSFAIIVLLINSMVDMDQDTLTTQRNFYGVLRVDEQDKGTKKHRRKLYNGQINHGMQLLYPTEKYRILSYYSAHSGIGIAFRHHPKRLRAEHAESTEGTKQDNHLKVGVIGLGIGLIASWGEPGDTFRFYEINPGVVRIANDFFTVLKESMAKTKVILGDGRISLERELASHGSMQFDMLVVDAFSGDAIPIHLITEEALQLYFKHLQPDGIVALHISNRHINLKPVVYGLAHRMDIPAILIKKRRRSQDFIKGSEWILMTRNAAFFDNIEVVHYMTPWPSDIRDDIIWTDDYSSLVHVLK